MKGGNSILPFSENLHEKDQETLSFWTPLHPYSEMSTSVTGKVKIVIKAVRERAVETSTALALEKGSSVTTFTTTPVGTRTTTVSTFVAPWTSESDCDAYYHHKSTSSASSLDEESSSSFSHSASN
eukprot:TRINITY_DN8309_c0_g1_i3.p1 TRINITY_DN8309_c0_g1~~TRINITY_DN8309_c0_g1_i3.p1  ORF type:complete len:126 (+),score=24.20 TRINITY_DN8309_c0_g1_i3:187-564(+)